ncbi:MAG: hypothetical protein HYU28_04755 [Actinobacteria bacterium]|nr:hypothetical protein [Actinomycetota bacterium]
MRTRITVRTVARYHGVVTAAALAAAVLSAAFSTPDEAAPVEQSQSEVPILYCVQSYSPGPETHGLVCDGGDGTSSSSTSSSSTTSSSTTSTTEGGGGGGATTTTTTTTATPQPTTTTTQRVSTPTTRGGDGGDGGSGGGGGGGGSGGDSKSSDSGGGSGAGDTGTAGAGSNTGSGSSSQGGNSATPGSTSSGAGTSDGGGERARTDATGEAKRAASVAVVPGAPAVPVDSLRNGLVVWSLAHGLSALYLLMRRLRLFLFALANRRRSEGREGDSPAAASADRVS